MDVLSFWNEDHGGLWSVWRKVSLAHVAPWDERVKPMSSSERGVVAVTSHVASHPAASADPIVAIAVILVMPDLQAIVASILPPTMGWVWWEGKGFVVVSRRNGAGRFCWCRKSPWVLVNVEPPS